MRTGFAYKKQKWPPDNMLRGQYSRTCQLCLPLGWLAGESWIGWLLEKLQAHSLHVLGKGIKVQGTGEGTRFKVHVEGRTCVHVYICTRAGIRL